MICLDIDFFIIVFMVVLLVFLAAEFYFTFERFVFFYFVFVNGFCVLSTIVIES